MIYSRKLRFSENTTSFITTVLLCKALNPHVSGGPPLRPVLHKLRLSKSGTKHHHHYWIIICSYPSQEFNNKNKTILFYPHKFGVLPPFPLRTAPFQQIKDISVFKTKHRWSQILLLINWSLV